MSDFVPTPAPVLITPIVRDVLRASYRLGGGLKWAGQYVNQSEESEGITFLNNMINGFKMENLMIQQYIRTVVNVNTNQRVYSVGIGQDWNIERPQRIRRAGYLIGSGTSLVEVPMQIVLSMEEWANFTVKFVPSSIPLALYYSPASPTQGAIVGQAELWPVPNAASTIAIYTPQFLEEVNTADDPLYMPDGYRELLVYNLAIRIHQMPPYNMRPMDGTVIQMARYFKARIKAEQMQPLFIGSDPAAMQESTSRRWAGANPKAWTPYSY